LGWSEGQWYISQDGEWEEIDQETSDWVVQQRANQPNWSGADFAHIALLRNSGYVFARAEVLPPEYFNNWPGLVSDIDITIYIIYLTKDPHLQGNVFDIIVWNFGNPGMYTHSPNIFVSPSAQAYPSFLHENMPEEYYHVTQYLADPNFQWSYTDQWINYGYRNNYYERVAKDYSAYIRELRVHYGFPY
jgi:hypothetical protein